MVELIWQLAIIGAVLVFAFLIGTASKFSGLKKKTVAILSLIYGAGILLISNFISGYSDLILVVIFEYSSLIFASIAIILILGGFNTIKNWKIQQKNQGKVTCAAMLASCPSGFGTILVATLMASPFIGISTAIIGRYVAIILALTIFGFYIASGPIMGYLKKPYPILLGNYMIFVGLYFLASAILVPNINKVLETPLEPLNVPSLSTLLYVLIMVGILMGLGIFINQKKSTLIEK